MFWSECRKRYSSIGTSDPDIKRYLNVSSEIQQEGYSGCLSFIQDMGHKYVATHTAIGSTLEIGFGRGRQDIFYKGHVDNYFPTDISTTYVTMETWKKYKNATIADAMSLPYPEECFDQVVSIYNLEHIVNVVEVFSEVKRVMKPKGRFVVALPCEGGFAWNAGRTLTTRRAFSRKYGIDYDKVIAYEHKHNLKEIINLLDSHFSKVHSRYYPFLLPLLDINLIYCGIYTHP